MNMPVTDSKRLKIQNYLVELLKSIKRSNGYNNSVVKVTKRLKTLSNISEFPELSVLAGNQTLIPDDESLELFTANARFGVVGYVRIDQKSQDDATLNDMCDGLIADIKHCLLSDTGIYTYTDATSLLIIGDEPLIDYETNESVIYVIITVSYKHDSIV